MSPHRTDHLISGGSAHRIPAPRRAKIDGYRAVRKLTVREWATQWMAAADPHLKRTTVSTHRSLLKLSMLPTFGRRLLRDVRPDVARWMAEMTTAGCSPS
jgi:hypothetical protein